jgi:hypothetical protein
VLKQRTQVVEAKEKVLKYGSEYNIAGECNIVVVAVNSE